MPFYQHTENKNPYIKVVKLRKSNLHVSFVYGNPLNRKKNLADNECKYLKKYRQKFNLDIKLAAFLLFGLY